MNKDKTFEVYTDEEFANDFSEFIKYTTLNMMDAGYIEPSYLIIIKRPDKIDKYFTTNNSSFDDKYKNMVALGLNCREGYIKPEEPGELLAVFMSHESWMSFSDPSKANDVIPSQDPAHVDAHTMVGYTVDGRQKYAVEQIVIEEKRIKEKRGLEDILELPNSPKPLFESFLSGFNYVDNFMFKIKKLLFEEAKEKYFIRYRICSDHNGDKYVLGFFKDEADRKNHKSVMTHASKVEKTQKLMEVLKKEIPPLTGSQKFDLTNFGNDGTAKDRHGNDISRLVLDISVPYNSDLNGTVFDNLVLSWMTFDQFKESVKGN